MKKNKLILILLIVGLFAITAYKTYAYYYRNIKVDASMKISNIICNDSIVEVSPSEKNIFGYSEFKIVVKNYDAALDEITGEPFYYSITIENDSDSDALYGYDGVFDSSIIINSSLSNDERKENSHIIQVKAADGSSKQINYKVTLNCVQSH